MNLLQLELFVAIVNSGSMRIAAERFYMSQSALSQNIKRLESELGCMLLDRTRSPLKPTVYGGIVLDRAERMLFLAQDMKDEIERKKALEADMLSIGCFHPMLANSEMVRVSNVCKSTRFNVTIADEDSIRNDLIRGKYDLVFLPDQYAIIPGFEKVRLDQEELFLSLPLGSPLAGDDVLPCEGLRGTRIVIPQDLAGVTAWYAEILRDLDFNPADIIKLPSEEYFSAMDDPSIVHFRSSLMTVPLQTLFHKKHVRLVEPEITRTIFAVYPIPRKEEFASIIDTLLEDAKGTTSTMRVLPKLLHLTPTSNLRIIEQSRNEAD